MKNVSILIILILLSCSSISWAENVNNQILLDEVQFLPQSPPGDWSFNSNCGPTAALIMASYLKDFTPSVDHLKTAIDWMYSNGYIVPQTSYGAEHYDGNLTNMGQLKKLLENHWQTGFVIKRNTSSGSRLYS